MPDSITEAQDYGEKTKKRAQSVDKVTGKRVWQCRVSDLDPGLAGRSRETVVKILADREPGAADPPAVRAGRVQAPACRGACKWACLSRVAAVVHDLVEAGMVLCPGGLRRDGRAQPGRGCS